MDTSEGSAKFFAGSHIKFDDRGRREGAPLVIVQWQKGVPITVYPAKDALSPPIWPRP